MPGSWRWPGFKAAGRNVWNPAPDAKAFPPKVWGYGWSFNFAYPLIKTKPLLARILMFVLGLAVLLLLLWALVSLGMIAYFMIEKTFFPQTSNVLEIVIQ